MKFKKNYYLLFLKFIGKNNKINLIMVYICRGDFALSKYILFVFVGCLDPDILDFKVYIFSNFYAKCGYAKILISLSKFAGFSNLFLILLSAMNVE